MGLKVSLLCRKKSPLVPMLSQLNPVRHSEQIYLTSILKIAPIYGEISRVVSSLPPFRTKFCTHFSL